MAKIYLASDHAGFGMKEALIPFLKERGHAVEDVGPLTYDENDDYPDYLLPMAARVAQMKGSFGIGIGGSGQGEAMVANRIKGARAAVYYGGRDEVLKKSREHNDANILSIGARFVSVDEAKRAVELWLATPFSGDERHVRRISKLGFTLVEILVAVSILSILASIVIFNVNEGRKATRDARRISDIKTYETAIKLYAQDYNRYPVCPTYTDFSCLQTTLQAGGYMPASAPQDPQHPSKQYYYDNWCNDTPVGQNSRRYRLWTQSETDKDGLLRNWWSDFYIGSTNCTDPS